MGYLLMGIVYCLFGSKALPILISAQWAMMWIFLCTIPWGFLPALIFGLFCGGCCFFLKRVLISILFIFVGQIIGAFFWLLTLSSLPNTLTILIINQVFFAAISIYLVFKCENSFLVYVTSLMGGFFFAFATLAIFQIPLTASLGGWFWTCLAVIVIFMALGVFIQKKQGLHLSEDEHNIKLDHYGR